MDRQFDDFSATYEELLRDPLRDRFGGGGSQFFHGRKRELILQYFRRSGIDPHGLSWLDVGCGRGDLLDAMSDTFSRRAGCDPSAEMLRHVRTAEVRVQEDPRRLPWDDEAFDFVSAVCVLHHVPIEDRGALVREMTRVTRRGGTVCIIEHNPFNPATRAIVARTPVDADAILLRHTEVRQLLAAAGLSHTSVINFLFLPQVLFRVFGAAENLLRWLPLGGQYVAFATK